MVRDVVCGMGVEEDDPDVLSMTVEGQPFYFCSPECLLIFKEEPREFMNRKKETVVTAKDPVCGMDVDIENAPCTLEYKGTAYYFCCRSCMVVFDLNPERCHPNT